MQSTLEKIAQQLASEISDSLTRCGLIFRIFSKLIDPELVSTRFEQRKMLQSDQICMIIYILFALICIMSMIRLIESYANIKTKGSMKLQAAIFSFAAP